mgnify:CR=1 FL=1
MSRISSNVENADRLRYPTSGKVDRVLVEAELDVNDGDMRAVCSTVQAPHAGVCLKIKIATTSPHLRDEFQLFRARRASPASDQLQPGVPNL